MERKSRSERAVLEFHAKEMPRVKASGTLPAMGLSRELRRKLERLRRKNRSR
jgi:hypothetical protein